jgi:hypothetical protein
VIAQLPQEQGGIKVPPDVTSSPKEDNDTETTRISIEEAYKEYIDVLVSEALVITSYIHRNIQFMSCCCATDDA